MFKRILIANRGEIAVRIIRACKELSIKTVAVYSERDKDSLHVRMADEAVCIGPAKAKDSYLNMKNIISATVLTGAEAIHPGFGFLSESSLFASMCQECGIVFIGPSARSIELMGDKATAKGMMIKAGVPTIPGSEGIVSSLEEAYDIADKISYPLLIKASAGGGGRGIRRVNNKNELKDAFNTAKTEAKNAFGDDSMYMEKLIEKPKHIEVQLLGDQKGNVVHLFERDCSIQRRNQKMLEEAPSPVLDEATRKRMGAAAVLAAKACGYYSTGTVEFLYDGKDFYFMEMNTRIQVEHPITELITGIDLVKWQIRIANGEELTFKQEDIKILGHAIECRINAEDTLRNFAPTPGPIKNLIFPGGPFVRIDSAAYQSYVIPPDYDSMIAKLIVFGADREEAIGRMKRALSEFVLEGVPSNIDFHKSMLIKEEFLKGTYNTGFIEDYMGIK